MSGEDEWGLPTSSIESVARPAATNDVTDGADDANDWCFLTQQPPRPDTQPTADDDEEDEWDFSTSLSKDAAPKPNKAPLGEDEWGFPVETTVNEPSDLLAKWGFDDESDAVTPDAIPAASFTDYVPSAAESLFEGWKTAVRKEKVGSDLSTFTTILSNLDVPGPTHLLIAKLKDRASKIGQGSQFTVFKDHFSTEANDDGKGVIIKRVRISRAALKAEQDLTKNEAYAQTLRHLELEVLSLGLLRHRNVVRLLGWGYDYEDRYTPVPILFMEAAILPLNDFLHTERKGDGVLAGLGMQIWVIKYHLALDVAAGIEALHALNIVHGDVKPENVLIFRQDDGKVPFVGKLSDFGVCIDMRLPSEDVGPESYLGTPMWTGSEVGIGQWKDDTHGRFEHSLLKTFDSYSFGLTVLSIFGVHGEAPRITKQTGPERTFGLFMEVEEALKGVKGCPDEILTKVKEASKKLLVIKPVDRPLPSPMLLQTDLPAYHEWLRWSTLSIPQNRKSMGHQYWFSLDMNVLRALDEQYDHKVECGNRANFPSETLFGLAEACSQQPIPDRHEKVLKYLRAAAEEGYVSARAICGKVYEALNTKLDLGETKLRNWDAEAVLSGFMFDHETFLAEDKYKAERQQFRNNGGYCDDPFLDQRNILRIAQDTHRLEQWIASNDVDTFVDSAANTMAHVCAAVGHLDCLKLLAHKSATTPVNEEGYTPLYKACQAGHTEAVLYLVQEEITASFTSTSITPLHWLFIFPEINVQRIAKALVQDAQIDVNALFRPALVLGRPIRYQMKHFPFEWPYGTPLHWACNARNKLAIDALLELGADINATYDNGHYATTPLAQAVFIGDVPLVKYLLEHGADVSIRGNGENLLHTITLGAGNDNTLASSKFDSWIRHGSWEKRFQATKGIIQLLLDAGLDIECKATTYGKYTPLMTAVATYFRKDYAVAALVDAGADPNVVSEANNTNALLQWCDFSPQILQYPHSYGTVLEILIERTTDLNVRGGSVEESALHMLLKQTNSTAQDLEYLKLLLADPAHCVDVNLGDRDGTTAIMKLCSTSLSGMTEKLNLLLELGAKPEAMNDYNENFIHSLVNNWSLMDTECLLMLKLLFAHAAFTPPVQDTFIAKTNLTALAPGATAISTGRPRTLEYLLSLGFGVRVNEPLMLSGTETSVLDQAIAAANSARLTYVRYASELITDEEIQDADANNQLYTTNAGVRHTYGGPSAARAKEAYWSFPEIFRMLKACGAKRLSGVSSVKEPSYTDATTLPQLHMSYATQPHLEHWRCLYDLEELVEGWEERAWDEFKDQYYYLDEDDLEALEVPVMVFERWPQVVEMLKAGEVGWYKGTLRDGRKVEVKMGDNGIEALRDFRGRHVDTKSR